MKEIVRSEIAASLEPKMVTVVYIPPKYKVSNINSLINNKTPAEVIQIMTDLDAETRKYAESVGGDVSTIKLHRLGRNERFAGRPPAVNGVIATEALVMMFQRLETKKEFEARVDWAVESERYRAEREVAEQCRKAAQVKKLRAALAALER